MLKKLHSLGLVLSFLTIPIRAYSGEFERWVEANVNIAIAEIDNLKTSGDAEWWAQARVAPIYAEFYLPKSVGKVRMGPYNTPMRDYDGEDLEKIAQSVERLMGSMAVLYARIPFASYDRQRIQLMDITHRMRQRNTPAQRYQEEIMKKYLQPQNR